MKNFAMVERGGGSISGNLHTKWNNSDRAGIGWEPGHCFLAGDAWSGYRFFLAWHDLKSGIYTSWSGWTRKQTALLLKNL